MTHHLLDGLDTTAILAAITDRKHPPFALSASLITTITPGIVVVATRNRADGELVSGATLVAVSGVLEATFIRHGEPIGRVLFTGPLPVETVLDAIAITLPR